MNRVVLGLDLDGVLYPYHEALYTYFQYEIGFNGSYGEFWNDYWHTLSKEKQDYFVSLPIPYELSVPSVRIVDFLAFAEKHSEIFYITSRHQELAMITERYLRRYDFPFQDNLVMTKDKVTACRLYGVTHFLDDFPHQVEAISKVADAYLMARIHNREYQDKFKTVHTLNEFKEKIFND